MTTKFLTYSSSPIALFKSTIGVERYHQFTRREVAAINAALAAGRPLLVRGDPGVGKTQLAEATAAALERAYYPHVVDSRTESRDLLYHFDAVMRLAEAQLCGALRVEEDIARKRLSVDRYVEPGPLWWAFNWKNAIDHVHKLENDFCDSNISTAAQQSILEEGMNRDRAANGWVVLIDEIDKAESDVPNGLLEALGAGSFKPLACPRVTIDESMPPPLIVITTNEERMLPDAFVRRCVVLHISLPSNTAELKSLLVDRGRAHFNEKDTSNEILEKGAEILIRDREEAIKRNAKPLPGQAEYLDMIRAVVHRHRGELSDQLALLETVANFIVKKSVDMQSDEKPIEESPELADNDADVASKAMLKKGKK